MRKFFADETLYKIIFIPKNVHNLPKNSIPIPRLDTYFFKIYSNIVLPSMHRPS